MCLVPFDQLAKELRSCTQDIPDDVVGNHVGCEACHGPASGHLAWAAGRETDRENNPARGFAFRLDERTGVTWTISPQGQAARSAPRQTTKEIEVCATCHSRRQQFSSDPLSLGRLLDAFRPATLESGLYHVDGQQRDEVFNHGSFLQSKMYAEELTCSDCHNPHSGKLHKDGNGACAECHAPEKFTVLYTTIIQWVIPCPVCVVSYADDDLHGGRRPA